MGKIMLSCKEAAQFVSQELDQPLHKGDRFKMVLHLIMCRVCSCYRKQLNFLHGILGRVSSDFDDASVNEGAHLSQEAKTRIKDRINDSSPHH